MYILLAVLILAAIGLFFYLRQPRARPSLLHSVPELAECELQISQLGIEIEQLARYQLQTLQPLCFAEKEPKQGKSLLFEHYNPQNRQKLYFYQENQNPNREAHELPQALQKVQNYQIHIDLLRLKIQFWEKVFNLRQQNHKHHVQLLSQYDDLEEQYAHSKQIGDYQRWIEQLRPLI